MSTTFICRYFAAAVVIVVSVVSVASIPVELVAVERNLLIHASSFIFHHFIDVVGVVFCCFHV